MGVSRRKRDDATGDPAAGVTGRLGFQVVGLLVEDHGFATDISPGVEVFRIFHVDFQSACSVFFNFDIAEVTGVTLSQEQHAIANERAAEKGLSQRARFLLQDYRDARGPFDRIVSVGMFEHVGVGHYEEFFRQCAQLLTDAFGRVREVVHHTVDGLTPDDLAYRAGDGANSIAWLVWHLTRGQDAQIADVYALEQVWKSGGWSKRFGLPFSDGATGYGQSSDEVAAVRVSPQLLLGYYDATQDATLAQIAATSDADLDRIVDTRWDPPVTLGARLISIIDDDVKHLGQAEYVKGLAQRAAS